MERNETMEEISLQELFFILRKRLWMIILLIVIGIVAAGLVSFYVLKPEYQTFTTLMVGKPKDYQVENKIEYNDLLLNQRLVHTYGVLVQSRDVSDKVIENLGLDMSFDTFSNKVSVNLVKDTEIIKIQVTDNDPVLATDIANETAAVFMDSVKKFMKVENVQVIDEAQVPKNPIKPRPMLNIAIAGVLGLMFGIFLVFLLEYLDNTIKTPKDVEKYLQLSVIGAIPKVKNDKTKLISLIDPKSPITEAFRTLRTNIQFSSIDKVLKTIVITSSTSNEGKSTVAANLAGTIAQGDKKVLLLDCDLRKPKVHKVFGLDNSEGLTNILVGNKTLEDVAYKYGNLENFSIITSGPIPPNPAELIGSKSMKSFLQEAEENFDMIIIDTPPVGVVTDSAVLSTIVDGIIIVASVGQTEVGDITRGKGLLDKVKSNIIGTVLNKVPIGGKSYYKYGYYKYYGYYGEEDNKRGKRRAR